MAIALQQLESALASPYMRAFLSTIGYSEGAGYGTLFGGGVFSDFSRHPNKAIHAGNYTSTAAGKYQFLNKTWQGIISKIPLSDFSPRSQDLGAVYLIAGRGALNAVLNNQFAQAIALCNKEWASFPGSPYGQPTHSLAQLQNYYEAQLGGPASNTSATNSALPGSDSSGDTTSGASAGSILALLAIGLGITIAITSQR